MKTIVLLLNRTSARVSINHIKVYKERITTTKKRLLLLPWTRYILKSLKSCGGRRAVTVGSSRQIPDLESL